MLTAALSLFIFSFLKVVRVIVADKLIQDAGVIIFVKVYLILTFSVAQIFMSSAQVCLHKQCSGLFT